ncbi:hypothetical protein RhiirC2_801678 [Rhizophagus irregularis]|uniref:RRM domain-containing protein n=1 Tax=Rhizophagus irregularis TaxID=588596 RepID=A0A2N1M244_9GLOM|nr:hypothetical protein RhiirC2_801678 [Rhizophagus irregularis]
MTTPPAPSVINPDILPPPRPDAMNVDITLPSAPAPNLISNVPSGLPVNKVHVITSPQNIITPVETVDASIHAPSNTSGKGKAVAFDIPERRPSPDGNAAAIKSAPSHYHAAAYLHDAPDAFKAKFTTNRSIEHVAILAGIPKNIKEADLLEIATQVNAKALNVPLSLSSYKPKPYVYLNFSLFESLKAAKEMTVSFRGKGLTWHPPNEAQTLCHVCGRPGCFPSVLYRNLEFLNNTELI